MELAKPQKPCCHHHQLPLKPVHFVTEPLQVEAFLQGPQATLTLSGFKNIKEARKTAEALLPPPPKPAYSYGPYGHSNRPTFSTLIVSL